MPVSIRDVAALMTTPRKVVRTGKENEVLSSEPNPLWTAELFMESLNSFIGVLNRRSQPQIEPITIEQAQRLLKANDPFTGEQYSAFERWAEMRIGFSNSGVTFMAPNLVTEKLPSVSSPLVLPVETEAADQFAFSDQTKALKDTKFARVAGPGVAVN